MTDPNQTYNKSNPFLSSIKDRYSLCKPGSEKSTYHVVLDLKNSGITYDIGDSIGIYATHDPELVNRSLKAMNAVGTEIINEKNTGNPVDLREFLTHKANITGISRKLLSEIAARQTDPQKKEQLTSLFEESNKDALKEYLANHELWDALQENQEARFDLSRVVSYADASSAPLLFNCFFHERGQ